MMHSFKPINIIGLICVGFALTLLLILAIVYGVTRHKNGDETISTADADSPIILTTTSAPPQ